MLPHELRLAGELTACFFRNIENTFHTFIPEAAQNNRGLLYTQRLQLGVKSPADELGLAVAAEGGEEPYSFPFSAYTFPSQGDPSLLFVSPVPHSPICPTNPTQVTV